MEKKANYFIHDSNSRNDEKIIRLRMIHGAAGYGVYFMLLERLRDEADYTIAADYKMLSFDFHVKPALIKSVVEDFDLFKLKDGSFYSASFLNRMQAVDNVSRIRSDAAKARWNKRTGANKCTDEENDIHDITMCPPSEHDNPYIDILSQSEEWKDIVCMRYHKKPEEIPKLIEDFAMDCRCSGKVHFSLQDAKSHFSNWLRIQIQEQNKLENYGKKRKPNKTVANSTEEFSDNF